MDEFDLGRELKRLLHEHANKTTAQRLLALLKAWNDARPMPPAGEL